MRQKAQVYPKNAELENLANSIGEATDIHNAGEMLFHSNHGKIKNCGRLVEEVSKL